MMNMILWSKGQAMTSEQCRAEKLTTQSAWQDHTFYLVPFTGKNDVNAMWSAVSKRFSRPNFGKFGGGSNIGSIVVTDYAPESQVGIVRIEISYSIGD